MVCLIIIFFYINTDVIGHVLEEDNLMELDKNGNKNKMIDIVVQDLQLSLFYKKINFLYQILYC